MSSALPCSCSSFRAAEVDEAEHEQEHEHEQGREGTPKEITSDLPFRLPCAGAGEAVEYTSVGGPSVADPSFALERSVETPSPNPPASGGLPPFSAADTAVRDAPPQPRHPRKTCLFCFEQILAEARKCPYCHEYLDPALAAERAPLKPLSGTAKASFWLGLLSPLFFCLPAPLAVLLGFGALVSPNRRKMRGTGMAIVGLLLGLLWTCALVLIATGWAGRMPSAGPPWFEF